MIVIINSGVHHNLGSSEYPKRVKQCALAVEIIKDYYDDLVIKAQQAKINGSIAPSNSFVNLLDGLTSSNIINSLRDVTLEMLETVHNERPGNSRSNSVDHLDTEVHRSSFASTDLMPPVVYRRARHVITENNRVLDTVQALSERDWVTVGRLMTESHASLSTDYEV